MNVKTTKVETGFYITINKPEKIYIIESDVGDYLALVWRTFKLVQNGGTSQYFFKIEYELQYNPCKNLSNNEKQMLQIYYHNLVRTLTDDIQTIYTDQIEERMQLPFYKNILHVKPL